MEPLTKKQNEVYLFVRHYIESTGIPPSRREICHIMGFSSVNAATTHLKALEKKGYVELLAKTSRGIRLVKEED